MKHQLKLLFISGLTLFLMNCGAVNSSPPPVPRLNRGPGGDSCQAGLPPSQCLSSSPEPSRTTFLDLLVTVIRSALIIVFLLVITIVFIQLAIDKGWLKVKEGFTIATLWQWGFYGVFAAIFLQFFYLIICLAFFKKHWQKYRNRYGLRK